MNTPNEKLLKAILNESTKNQWDCYVKNVGKLSKQDIVSDAAVRILIRAANYDKPDVISELASMGADINRCIGGLSVLGVAATAGRKEAIAALLELQADVNVFPDKGKTPLQALVDQSTSFIWQKDEDTEDKKTRYYECVIILLKNGADPNIRYYDSHTVPTDTLAGYDWPELLNTLFDYGARMEQCRDNGSYALKRAIDNKLPANIAILLERGVNPNNNVSGKYNALQYAESKNENEIASYLKSKGMTNSTSRRKCAKSGNIAVCELFGEYSVDIRKTMERKNEIAKKSQSIYEYSMSGVQNDEVGITMLIDDKHVTMQYVEDDGTTQQEQMTLLEIIPDGNKRYALKVAAGQREAAYEFILDHPWLYVEGEHSDEMTEVVWRKKH